MTSEQLQSARAERWRQVSNPVVTAEDARAWLEGVGLCLFLPRRSHAQAGLGFAPSPSFVEAVVGAPSEAPTREQVESATALLHRLTAEGAIAPLNLFGGNHFGAGGASAAGAAMGVDTPDFVVTREALPYVFSLIGGRNWKSGPGGKASPLMTEIWTLLNDGEPRSAQEIQATLGRELTEAAVLRALVELWNGLRVIPVYGPASGPEFGDDTRWELTQAKFAAEMTASQKVAQVTALSALMSMYLEAVVAASSEDVETFLSPLAARSRVREVVNGLLATRQLTLVSIGAQPLVHVTGMLPEFEPAPAAEAKPAEERRRPARPAAFEKRKPFEKSRPREERKDFRREKREERRPYQGGRERRGLGRGGHEEGRERRTFDRGARASADRGGRRGGRPEDRGQRRERPTDRSERGPERGKERPYRKPFDRERRGEAGERNAGERRFGDRERRPFADRERRPFGKKPFGKDFGPRRSEEGRAGGARREGGKFPPKRLSKGGERSWRDRGERSEPERPLRGDRRRFEPRREERGAGRKFEQRESGEEGFKKSGFGKAARGPSRRPGKPFGKMGKPFGKSGKPGFGKTSKPGFGKPSKPGFGKPGFGGPKRAGKPGGFKPPFKKRKKDEGGSE